MKNFLIRWLVTSLAIFIVANLFGLVYIESLKALVLASLILGILNVFLRPVLIFMTFPLIFFTLGFFIFVINAFILYIVAKLVPGFEVLGFWKTLLAAFLITVFCALINYMIKEKKSLEINHQFKLTN
jgi:putative membrane protein